MSLRFLFYPATVKRVKISPFPGFPGPTLAQDRFPHSTTVPRPLPRGRGGGVGDVQLSEEEEDGEGRPSMQSPNEAIPNLQILF